MKVSRKLALRLPSHARACMALSLIPTMSEQPWDTACPATRHCQLDQPATCAMGNLNCDNRDRDLADVQQVAGAWNTVAWSIGYNPRANLVRDGRIDIDDIIAVAGLWHSQ